MGDGGFSAVKPRSQLPPGAPGSGKVWLVGAGPGDPELLTVKALRLVQTAEVLAHDALVPEDILALAPRTAERIAVGRRAPRDHAAPGVRRVPAAPAVHPLVLERALAGRTVVRLKGGDPGVFGRAGEELLALTQAGVTVEIVPGITAALGAAAAAAMPLTQRDGAASVTLVTATSSRGDGTVDFSSVVPREGTVVVYMGLCRLAQIAAALVATGRPWETPVALVSRASTPGQRVLPATLGSLAERANALEIPAPALLIVGAVAAHAVAPARRATLATQ